MSDVNTELVREDWVYDEETYPNIFTACFYNGEKDEGWVFEISDRKNDRKALMSFLAKLHKGNHRLVGFNNIGFDYPVLHYVMYNKECTAESIYNKAMEIIKLQGDDKFAAMIPKKKWLIEQIDLYKIWHFDNKARATSLKMIEFNMRSDNIEDLPFPVGTVLNDQQKETLIKYNEHDVMQTYKFYLESKGAIAFREQLSEKYGKDFMNHNDTKIGKDYFIMRLEEESPNCCYVFDKKLRKNVVNQTKRKSINLGEVILPYVKFTRPEFQAVKDWLASQTITETKGVFSDIMEYQLGDVAKYAEMVEKKKKLKGEPTPEEVEQLLAEKPMSWIDPVELKSGKISYYWKWRVATNLNVVIDGFRYDFGTGGLHGSVPNSVFFADDSSKIVDFDVTSYYPSLSIVNKIYPEHLGEMFCEVYEDVFNQRKSYAKGTPENAVMKLALNGTYGASNDKFSPFYDPKFTMAITINGQLLLCLLAEMLMDTCDVQMIQANTDGVTFTVSSEMRDKAEVVRKEWEDITRLQLEGADYSKMFVRDVNNYVALYCDGNVKRKGAYEFDGLDWSKNQSSLVIKKAAFNYIMTGGDIETFIKSHKDKMDFMLRTKVPRSSRLVTSRVEIQGDEEVVIDTPQQNICRYYIANDGESLVKIMPPLKEDGEERRIGVDKAWLVKTCNDIKDYDGDINFDYYVEEAKKLIDFIG
jgi:hypothetical protein